MITTATIEILSQINATLSWQNTGSLGTILVGEVSEFYVKAELSTSSFTLKYKVLDGELPPGLSLYNDGTIQGRVSVTTSTIYDFGIAAVDVTGYEFITGDFSITVNQTTSTEYTQLWCKPFLTVENRSKYNNFITDPTIFRKDLIYRINDPAFGVQLTPKMYIEFGVEQVNLEEYAEILNQNFYKRRFQFGEVKFAYAQKDGKSIYEVIYVDIIDKYNNNEGVSISSSFTFNGVTYYPASVTNMRDRISSSFKTTTDLNPQFTKTIQPESVLKLGYIKFVPICYVLPGKSIIVLRRIKDSKFKFNVFNFEVDRLIVEKPKNYSGNKYLMVDRNSKIQ